MQEDSETNTVPKRTMMSRYPIGQAWYAVILLLLLYIISFTDRMILALLAAPVSEALNVSDTQIGILFGVGFGVVYALMGLPLAHFVDRHNRIRLVTAGVLVWSACTVASGFSPNYAALMVLRAGVAVGEAVLTPAAISLIADMFPRDRRALPTTVYTSPGSFMGAGAFILGGLALDLATDIAPGTDLPPWQLTMIIVGIPGLLIAPLLYLTVPEPPRIEEPKAENLTSARQALRYVFDEKALWGFLALAMAAYTIIAYAKTAWLPTLLVRGYGLSASDAGYVYGALGSVSALLGLAAWPIVGEYWRKRGRADAYIILYALGVMLSGLSLVVVGFTRTEEVLYLAIVVQTFSGGAAVIFPPLIIQAVAPSRMRARLMAGNFMAANLIGLTIGPTLVAFIADSFFEGRFAIAEGIFIVAMVATPISGWAVWLARRRFLIASEAALSTAAD